MRRVRRHVLTLAVAAAVAAHAPASGQAEDPMKPLLRAWEKQSARLETLDVEIKRVDESKAWGKEEYVGRAILKRPNLALLDFSKVEVDEKTEKPVTKPHERIVCTGTEIWQYRTDAKQIFIFPIDRNNRDRALEEGPLPFLFNMKAAEAEARYIMSLINQTNEYYVISVVPKEKIDQESFSKALIKLSRQTFLPDELFLRSPDEKSTKHFYLVKVRPNAPVNAKNFEGKPLPPPWQVVRNPGADLDAAAAPAGRNAAPAPAPAQAQARPATTTGGAPANAPARRVR